MNEVLLEVRAPLAFPATLALLDLCPTSHHGYLSSRSLKAERKDQPFPMNCRLKSVPSAREVPQVTPVPPVLRVSRVCEANQVIPDLPAQPVHLVHAVSLVFLEKTERTATMELQVPQALLAPLGLAVSPECLASLA